MRTLIATIAVTSVVCLSGAAHAQQRHSSHGFFKNGISFGLDTDVSIPLGNYADANSVGGGAMVIAEYHLLDMVGATMRVGFEAHMNRTIGLTDSHVHAIPVLLGTKYYMGGTKTGMFGAFELGIFDLMQSQSTGGNRPTSTSSNDVKFGMGAGLGYQQDRWNVRLNLIPRTSETSATPSSSPQGSATSSLRCRQRGRSTREAGGARHSRPAEPAVPAR